MGIYEEVMEHHRRWRQGFNKPMRLGVNKRCELAAGSVCYNAAPCTSEHQTESQLCILGTDKLRFERNLCIPKPGVSLHFSLGMQ